MTVTIRPKARSLPVILAERKTLLEELTTLAGKLQLLDQELESSVSGLATTLGAWITPTMNSQVDTQSSLFSGYVDPSEVQVSSPLRNSLINKRMHVVTHFEPASKRSGEIGLLIQHHASEFMRTARRPLKTREILEMLKEIGVEVPGKDPLNNLSAHLSRSDVFTRVGDGWWFAEKQEPPGGGS